MSFYSLFLFRVFFSSSTLYIVGVPPSPPLLTLYRSCICLIRCCCQLCCTVAAAAATFHSGKIRYVQCCVLYVVLSPLSRFFRRFCSSFGVCCEKLSCPNGTNPTNDLMLTDSVSVCYCLLLLFLRGVNLPFIWQAYSSRR